MFKYESYKTNFEQFLSWLRIFSVTIYLKGQILSLILYILVIQSW